MTLNEDMVEFPLWNGVTESVPRKDIIKLQLHKPASPGNRDPGPSRIAVMLSFSREKPGQGCRCLLVEISPANYLTLLQYMPLAATRH